MNIREFLAHHVSPYWKSFIVVLTPLLLLPVTISGTQEASVAYVMLIMAVYWMTEALPLPVTSLIPVVAFPLFGIMNTGQVCINYFTETVMMFVGGLIIGLAVEYCNLHQRIALRVILSVGTDPKWLMLGVMSVTMFLSMWVSNTGATAMIVPIVEALIQQLFKGNEQNPSDSLLMSSANDKDQVPSETTFPASQHRGRRLRVTLLLAVAYSANVGGTGTLIGSTPQLALKGIIEEFCGTNTSLTFSSWMAVNVPAMLINTLLIWVWLQFLLNGFKCRRQEKVNQAHQVKIKNLVQKKYDELGPMTFHEKTIAALFVLLVSLWMFRDPKFIAGWGSLFSKKIGDSVPVVAIILLLFALPIELNFWCFRSNSRHGKANESMLSWPFIREKMPWGLVLLLGSGFALSDASRISGLSKWLGAQLSVVQVLPKFAILFIACMISTWMTEVVSNTATANIILPILAQMAETININPLYLMIPAAATCCYTFVLPVGTPPNAIVYGAAKMKPIDMIKGGMVAKMICVLVLCVVMETLGTAVFPSDQVGESFCSHDAPELNVTLPPTN